MKTMGKVTSPKLNDFDLMSDQLSDGLVRLKEVGQNVKLSAEQQIAMDKAFKQIEMLRDATKACGRVERFAEPAIRNKGIEQTISGYDASMFDHFDYLSEPFGSPEMLEEREVARIDRYLAVNDMIAGIHGSENLADMNYDGYDMDYDSYC